jgi:thioredoxin-related protein
MNKLLYILLFITLTVTNGYSQKTADSIIYNPNANAESDLEHAVIKAKAEGKHVLVQVGGNWCPWCIRLHKFYTNDLQLDSIIKADYVLILINYSKENKNIQMMKKLEFPNRFGFPALVVLDGDGKLLHIQDSGYLEACSGGSYNKDKILTLLKNWTVRALDPKNYFN